MPVKRSDIVAFGGVLTGLSLLLILLTRVIPFTEMALPAVAGALLIAAVIELGAKWSVVIYAAVGLFSLIFTFDNGAAFYYIVFFGLYSIVKNYIEHIRSKLLQWVVKIVFFNLCAAALYFIIAAVSGLPAFVTRYGLMIALALSNAVFIVYDIALSRLIVTYITRLRSKFFRRS